MSKPKIIYCEWEGDPAVIYEYPDNGGYYGYYDFGKGWKGDKTSDVFTKGRIVTKAVFDKMFPNKALPPFPK